jgi:hypothetical protein
MTVIAGTTRLTPIASVDTSSANGVSMFTLLLDSAVISAGNLFQFEYYISTDNGLQAVEGGNNFIALEDAVTTAGISNQITIAVPSLSNENDPTTPLFVKIRAYVASETGAGINVSTWSNQVPVYNPPPQPGNPIAFMVLSGLSNELLYVNIPNNDLYDLETVKFIISYCYTGLSGTNQWVVSEPLMGTLQPNNIITFNALAYESELTSDVYVAVNAVFSYTYETESYYTVSQISATVQASEIIPEPAVLAPIVIPTDYLVYSTREQQVVLNWTAPINASVPGYEVASYEVVATANGVLVDTIPVASGLLNYTYNIPVEYTNAGESSAAFSFVINTLNLTGDRTTSNSESVNTFTYATAPVELDVVWANEGTTPDMVDMLVTFYNPSNIGQGQPVGIELKVFDDSGVDVYTHPSITYVDSINPYPVFLTNIPSTPTGSVVVYMVNTDTNAQTDDGEILNLPGASATQTYEISSLPFIYDVVRTTADGLEFKVSSNTALVEINQLVGPHVPQVSPYLFGVQYLSVPNPPGEPYTNGSGDTEGTYTVTEVQQDGSYTYTFNFDALWLFNAGLITNLLITAANGLGIQVEPVPAPPAPPAP